MRISCSDCRETIDIGSYAIFHSLYSTIKVNLQQQIDTICLAVQFLETGKCDANLALETARQFNLIRDALSQFPPHRAVYDCDNPHQVVPWAEKISPVITSCANYYTTSDGRDLLFEIVRILCYASYAGTQVTIL